MRKAFKFFLAHACAESLYSLVDDMRLELQRIVAEELRMRSHL